MLVVIDTNVLYQSLRSKNGASNYILRLIRSRQITLALTIAVFLEYEEVLKRKDSLKDLNLKLHDIDSVLRYLAYIGKSFNTFFRFRPNLRDEDDNIFIELAVTSNSKFLITSNIRDYKNAELRFDDLHVISPADFVRYWRKHYEEKS